MSTNLRRPSARRSTSSLRSSASRAARAPGGEQPQLQRAADRHELQQVARARADAVDAQVDELSQARPRFDLAAPAPHAAVLGQQAAVDAVAHQLAQEEGVAARQLPHRVDAGAVDRTAQPGREEVADLSA
jgi:hypothetical protein